MTITGKAEYSPSMDRFAIQLDGNVPFLAAVDALKRAADLSGHLFTLHMNHFGANGSNSYIAVFNHTIGGPIKDTISLRGTAAADATLSNVSEIKGPNWQRFTSVVEQVLLEFGGKFQVSDYREGGIVIDKKIKAIRKGTPSAFLDAATRLAPFCPVDAIPSLIEVISTEENRQRLEEVMSACGDALSAEKEPEKAAAMAI